MQLNIKNDRSFARKHVRQLKLLEKQGISAYSIVMKSMVEEIKKYLVKEKLSKSEKIGWTGDVASVSINLDEISRKVITRHLDALRWVLIGDAAGKDARKFAKELGLTEKFIPGIIQSSYLSSLDIHREYFLFLTGIEADIPNELIGHSMEHIVSRTDRYIKQSIVQIENNILNALNKIADNFNFGNIARTHTNVVEDGYVKNDRVYIPKTMIDKELKDVVKNYRSNWDRTVITEVGLSSSTATHQAMYEIFGAEDDEVQVVVLTSKDERLCKFCNGIANNPDGTFKFYRISDFKPAGYNLGKTRLQWEMCIPGFHINCRCMLIYVPKGFTVDSSGNLIPK
jgi:hypothetical protein